MKIRMTPHRKEILHVLKTKHGTLSAKDIHKILPHIDLATIYRNLELFVREKLIRKVHVDTEEAQYEHQPEPHHHAVCSSCKRIIHFSAPETKLKKLLGIENFSIKEIEITVRGTCTHTVQKPHIS